MEMVTFSHATERSGQFSDHWCHGLCPSCGQKRLTYYVYGGQKYNYPYTNDMVGTTLSQGCHYAGF